MAGRSVQNTYDDSASRLLEAVGSVNACLRLPQLLTSIVDATVSLAACDRVGLYTNQDGVIRCVAAGGAGEKAQYLARSVPLAEPLAFLREMRTRRRIIYIPNVEIHHAWSDLLQSIPEADQVRTWLGLPLIQQDRLLGFIGLGYHGVTEYHSVANDALVEFSRHVSTAYVNAMVLAEESARARMALLRATILETLRDVDRIESVSEHVATAIGQALDASWCGVYLGLGRSQPTRAAMFAQRSASLDGRVESVIQSILTLVAHDRRTLAVPDIANDVGGEVSIRANRELLLASGVCSLLVAPLALRGEFMGAIVVVQIGTPREWESGEVMLIEQVASEVAARIVLARSREERDLAYATMQSERDVLRSAAFQSPSAIIIAGIPPYDIQFWNSAAVGLARSGTPMSASGHVEPPRFGPHYVNHQPYPIERWPLTRAFRECVSISSEESLLQLRDGSFATVLVSATPMTDDDGRPAGAFALIQDVSLQRQAEKRAGARTFQFHAICQLLSHLVAHLTHDDVELDMLREMRKRLPFDAALLQIGTTASDVIAFEAGSKPREVTQARQEIRSLLRAAADQLSFRLYGRVVQTQGAPAELELGSQLAEAGYRSVLTIPILPDNQFGGAILLADRRSDAYDENDLDFAASLGQVLITCHVLRSRLDDHRHGAMRTERDRLARDIHDVLAQMITSIVLQLEHTLQRLPDDSPQREVVEQARDTARSAIAETRRIVWNLRSASVTLEDPRTVVRIEAPKLERRVGIKPEVVVTGEPKPLRPETGSVVQRFVRVGLDNVWSHSEARNVRILLDYGEHAFTLLIEDDGKGFDPSEIDLMGTGRVGLAGAAERARLVGGSLRIESAAQQGTRAWCVVPYTPSEPASRTRDTVYRAATAALNGEARADGQRIRVVLIDDHSMVRQGLEHMLAEHGDIKVIGAAGTGSDGLRIINDVRPDVVLCDLQLPDISGVEVISRVRMLFPDIRCVIVTTYDNDDYIYEGIKSGAKGYVLKDVSSDELAQAVRAAARNESLLQPIVAGKLLERFGEMARHGDVVEQLTEREMGVLRALATGSRNKEIAQQLSLSESTVKTHLASIFGKLAVTTRTEAVTRGRELGLIPL